MASFHRAWAGCSCAYCGGCQHDLWSSSSWDAAAFCLCDGFATNFAASVGSSGTPLRGATPAGRLSSMKRTNQGEPGSEMVYPILSARRATSRSPRCSCPHPLSHIATSKARMCERARPSPSAIPWHLDGSWGLENSSFLWLLVVQVIIGIELLIGG